MAKLRWTESAIAWLEEIYDYIAADNPVAANSVIDGIISRAESASRFPGMGSLLKRVAEGDVRMVLYGHYRVAYLHRPDHDLVEILGVFHGALEIEQYLSRHAK